jgi:hypothetical protein
MEDRIEQTVVRAVRPRLELRPVQIYMGEPPAPIDPDWIGIVRHTRYSDRIQEGRESYRLSFFNEKGEEITYEGFDSLEIALDQAKRIVGINHNEWVTCTVPFPEDDIVPWKSVLQMDLPGDKLEGARVICYAVIDDRCRPTGSCGHHVGGQLMGPARGLAICQYESEDAYYLFYCDESWRTVTDGWHQSLEDAKRQAEFEYQGISNLWVNLP